MGKILQMKNCLAYKGIQMLLIWSFVSDCFLIYNRQITAIGGGGGTNQDFGRTERFVSHNTCILFPRSRAITTYEKDMQDPFQTHFNAPVSLGHHILINY